MGNATATPPLNQRREWPGMAAKDELQPRIKQADLVGVPLVRDQWKGKDVFRL